MLVGLQKSRNGPNAIVSYLTLVISIVRAIIKMLKELKMWETRSYEAQKVKTTKCQQQKNTQKVYFILLRLWFVVVLINCVWNQTHPFQYWHTVTMVTKIWTAQKRPWRVLADPSGPIWLEKFTSHRLQWQVEWTGWYNVMLEWEKHHWTPSEVMF